jgi:hypothetical protein
MLQHFLRIAVFSALCALSALAQFDSAVVLGTVRDPQGLAIKGAQVKLDSLATGVRLTGTTNDQGSFEFPTVRLGEYVLTAEASGFKTGKSEAFRVTVGAKQRVDLNLQIGTTSETVTIDAAVAQLETETSSRGTVIGAQQIVNLPLNGRAYADLALLAPGVRRSGISVSRDASFNVNGMRSSQNNFVVDGVDNNSYGTSNQGFSNQVVQLSPDAVQEFRLETNNFSAEYGRAGGAVINATIRSGSNQFHGTVYNYLRNTQLNAVGFFKPATGKPTLIQNQYGATFGGPIVKDKMFFFTNYEAFRRTQKTVAFATLPSLDARAGRMGIPILDPITGAIYGDGVIPATRITRWASTVLGGLPTPNINRAANNYQSLPGFKQDSDKGDVRYDQYISSKLNVFVRYSHRLLRQFEPGVIDGPSGGNNNGDVRVLNQQMAFGSTYTLSPTSILEFRMGISRTEGGKVPIFVGTEPLVARLQIPNAPTDPRFTGGVYTQGVNGYTAFGVQSSNPQFQNPFVWNPKFNYTKLFGKHSLKAGYEFQRIETDIDDFNPKMGSDSYSGRFSQVAGSANNDLQFMADFLFGARSQYQLNNSVIVNLRQQMNFFYLQDDWKISRKLTLNLGLRYELATPQYESANRISNFIPASNSLQLAKDGSIYDRALVNMDRNNFAPRIGLAWSALPKTVVRAGYGISYIHFNRMGGENLLSYNLPHVINPISDQRPPFSGAGPGLPLCTSLAQGPQTCFRPTEQGYPNGFLSASNINQVNVRANYIPGDLPTSYTQSWHFSIQRELGKNLVLDMGYVGTRGVNLMILGDFNQARPNGATENLSLQARRPIQNFGFIQAAFPGGFLNYHAFQAKIEKRFSQGLYLLNSFTWSKAIDNASGHLETGNGDNSRVNYADLRNERGLGGYDQPFNNTSTVLYELPIGRGRKWGSNMNKVADLAIGGWRFTAINFATSGTTVNLTYGPAAAFQVSGAPNYRPNIIGDPVTPAASRNENNWLNAANVQIPTDRSRPFGNAGRNIVRGPRIDVMNLGLHKEFSLTERFKLEFRTEAFNALNRTNFDSPNSNRSSGAFGTITSTNANPARQVQFALRLAF